MKVVINRCWGGFSVSLAAAKHMAKAGSEAAQKALAEHETTLAAFRHYKRHGKPLEGRYEGETSMFDIDIKYGHTPKFHGYFIDDGRHDPLLVAAVEALGEKANGEHASLRIVEIPDGVEYEIDNYDGQESIHEQHRSWA